MSSLKYVQDVVSNAKHYPSANYGGRSLPKRVAVMSLIILLNLTQAQQCRTGELPPIAKWGTALYHGAWPCRHSNRGFHVGFSNGSPI